MTLTAIADRALSRLEERGEFKGLALYAMAGMFAAVSLMILGFGTLMFLAYLEEKRPCGCR